MQRNENTLLSWLKFACRVGLSLIAVFTAFWCLRAPHAFYLTVDQFGLPRPETEPQLVALAALLVVAAIWLAAGIRSRVVAALCCAMILGSNLALDMALRPPLPELVTGLTVALAVPVILGGGGKLALYRRGWRDLG